jgi:hypothetical protein
MSNVDFYIWYWLGNDLQCGFANIEGEWSDLAPACEDVACPDIQTVIQAGHNSNHSPDIPKVIQITGRIWKLW